MMLLNLSSVEKSVCFLSIMLRIPPEGSRFTPFRIEDAQYATPSPLITALCYAKKWAF